MEFKHFAFELKAEDEAARAIEGWGAVFGNVDSDNDIILPGAFTASLKKRKPKMCWQHDSRFLPGVWDETRESEQGLFMKGRFVDTPLGNEVHTLAKAGAIDSMSIGYYAKKYDIDTTGIRHISEIELFEVSLVTFPANESARITGVKSKPATERELEQHLRDVGFSQSEAKKIVAEGYKAIAPQRDVDEQTLSHLTNLFNQFKA